MNKKQDKVSSYLDLLKKSFECSICISYLEDPVITNCMHIYCSKCIHDYLDLKRNTTCPLCKCKINPRSLKDFDVLNKFTNYVKNIEQKFKLDIDKKSPSTNRYLLEIENKKLSDEGIKKRKRDSIKSDNNSFEDSSKIKIYKVNDNDENNQIIHIPDTIFLDENKEKIPFKNDNFKIPDTIACDNHKNKNYENFKIPDTIQVEKPKFVNKPNSFHSNFIPDTICQTTSTVRSENIQIQSGYKIPDTMFEEPIIVEKLPNDKFNESNFKIPETMVIEKHYDQNVTISEQIINETVEMSEILENRDNQMDQTELIISTDPLEGNSLKHDFSIVNALQLINEPINVDEDINSYKTDPSDETHERIEFNDSIHTNYQVQELEATVLLEENMPQSKETENKMKMHQSSKKSIESNREFRLKKHGPNITFFLKGSTKSFASKITVKDAEIQTESLGNISQRLVERNEINIQVTPEDFLYEKDENTKSNHGDAYTNDDVGVINDSLEGDIVRSVITETPQKNETAEDDTSNLSSQLNQTISKIGIRITSLDRSREFSMIKPNNNITVNPANNLNVTALFNFSQVLTATETNRRDSDILRADELLGKSYFDASIARTMSSTMRLPSETQNTQHFTCGTYNFESYEFVFSLIKPELKEKVKLFTNFIGAKIADNVNEKTTHLIVQSDEDLTCGVTSKYLKAISMKLWIISVQWILNCINKNKLFDIANYEIKGDTVFGVHNAPQRSRLSTSRLFQNEEFMIVGQKNHTINLDELYELGKLNGARFVSKAKEFGDNKSRIVLFDETVQSLDKKTANFMRETAKIECVSISWFFDSLASYNLRDMEPYKLYS